MIQIDERIGGVTRYRLGSERSKLVRVPDPVRKCTVFVAHETKAKEYQYLGTAFFVSRPIIKDHLNAVYCVTAMHVIDQINERSGSKLMLRVNMVGGRAQWIETTLDSWRGHPIQANLDVAVTPFPLADEHDHLACPLSMFLDDERIKREGVGVGDEIFLSGLFSKHTGTERNIPIVRIGNIAAMPEEEIRSQHWVMPAYLVEARSIGGLSGSPVFVQLGTSRITDGVIKYAAQPVFYLMGMMHGHWNSPSAEDIMIGEDAAATTEKLNMGIAIVVPISKVLEVLNQPAFKSLEESDAECWHQHNDPNSDDDFGTRTLSTTDF